MRGLAAPRFRSGLVGEKDPIARWQAAVDNGEPDPLPRLIRLLETTPGVTGDGSIVYPYLALKDATTWDDLDVGVLLGLGFTADDVEATMLKGRYLDERAVFDVDGAWKAFAIGA